MRQIIDILLKDLRRFWPETAISILLLGLYAWSETRAWYSAVVSGFSMSVWSFWLPIFLLLSYILLVVRVVQEESLVGDRQFWITRPYEWKKLLAAKIFFVLIAVNVPLFLVQLYLLKSGGFRPALYLASLLWWHIRMLMGMPILAIVTLAVVTRNLARAGLTLLAVLLAGVGLLALALWLDSGSSSMSRNVFIWDHAGDVIIVAVPMGVIIWQYARRKTRVALTLLAAGVAAYAILEAATPERELIERSFPLPAPGGQPLLHVSLGSEKPAPPKDPSDGDGMSKDVSLRLQILASLGQTGQAISYESPASVVQVKGFRLTVEAPGEKPWDSGWQGYETLLTPGENAFLLKFAMKRAIFERIKSSPVKTQLELAVDLYQEAETLRAMVSRQEFSLGGARRCSLSDDYLFGTMLNCRAPLTEHGALLVRTAIRDSTCKPVKAQKPGSEPFQDKPPGNQTPADQPVIPAGTVAYAWHIGEGSGTINPVRMFALYFSKQGTGSAEKSHRICSGTPLIFGQPERRQRLRAEMQVDGIKLGDYEVRENNEGVGWSISVNIAKP